MKYHAKHFLILFIFLLSQSLFAENNSPPANQLAQYLNRYTTFRAQFSQQTFSATHRVIQSSQGVMMLMRPGQFRWDTVKPSRQIVVTNGKFLWIYDVDLKQVTKQTLKQSGADPAQLLSGHVNVLLQQFHVTLLKKMGDTIIFQLKPKKTNEQFQSVTLIFSHEILHELHVENSLNQTTIFIFTQVQLNTRMNSTLFNFKPPKGVDVL